MKIEHERKFILSYNGKSFATQAWYDLHIIAGTLSTIRQGYLSSGSDPELRVREIVMNGHSEYFLTLKNGSGISRKEIEFPITHVQFNELWPETDGRRIFKSRRFSMTDDLGVLICVDKYIDRDLLIVEAESDSLTKLKKFPIIGKEVTDNERYKNRNLAT